MKKITIEQDPLGLYVTLTNTTPILVRDTEPDSHNSLLKFYANGVVFVAVLTPDDLQMMGLQCMVLMPSLAQQYSGTNLEDVPRLQARPLKKLDNRSIQLLLRESQSDILIDFLWYMKDPALIELILKNMSQRAAEMLMEDLDSRWRGVNPDSTSPSNTKRGRDAAQETVAIFYRLIAKGLIPNFPGERA